MRETNIQQYSRLRYHPESKTGLHTLRTAAQGCRAPYRIRLEPNPVYDGVETLFARFNGEWKAIGRLQTTTRFKHWYFLGAYFFDTRPSLVLVRRRKELDRIDLFVFSGYYPSKGERNKLLAETARAWKDV